MGIGMAMHNDPRFREQVMKAVGAQKSDNTVKEPQQKTAARIQNFGLMGAYAGPAARRQMNESLRVRASEFSPSTARRMNRKGG